MVNHASKWKGKRNKITEITEIQKYLQKPLHLSYFCLLLNGICLTNYVRSCMLRYISQIAKEASIFTVILFRAWFYDNQFSKIKFNLLKTLEASQEHTRAMLVKMHSFIPQFNQFHPEGYYHIASLDGYFWINL